MEFNRAVLSSWLTVSLEGCGEMLLWRAGCFTRVIHLRLCVKSFDLWIYLEKGKITISFYECQLLRCEGHCLLLGTHKAWWKNLLKVGSRDVCELVWWLRSGASSKHSWVWHVSPLGGKAASVSLWFGCHRCLNSQACSFIFIFWHVETPLGSSPVFSFVLNYLMIKIWKQSGKAGEKRERSSLCFCHWSYLQSIS